MPESAQLLAATEAIHASRTPLSVDLPGTPNSWREWLSQIALAAADGPVIAVLDEFPWIAAGDRAGLEGLLQVMWDRVLEGLPVLLVLIGSDLAMMERLAQHDRPLFGRVRELVMPALNPAEVASALPGAAPFDVFETYLITGGYPRLVASLQRSGMTPADDPYLRFWFRYVVRHIDAIARGRGDVAFAAFERDWPSWRGRTVEPVVRRAVELLGATDDRLSGIESALPWWSRDGQVEVDVVGANQERTTLLGTIKWRESRGVSRREVADLTVLRTRVPRAADAALAAISPHGTAPAEADLSLSAADLLTAWQR